MGNKRIICICNTFYQLIMYIQMRKTILRNSFVTLLISDHSKNAEEVAGNILQLDIFDEVHFIRTLNYDHGKENLFRKAIKTFQLISGKKGDFIKIAKLHYDELIYYNFNATANLFFSMLIKSSPDLICSRVEEGLISYNYCINDADMEYKGCTKIASSIRKICHLQNLKTRTNYFYCLFPELYHGNKETVPIPFTDEQMAENGKLLASAFKIDRSKMSYHKKYIFFSGVGDIEGGKPIGELDIANLIASIVGKNNMLIKKHPRDKRDVYEKNGFHVDCNSNVPWETIVLNYDFKDHVFLSVTSGSVMFGSAVLNQGPKTFYLYNLCQNRDTNSVAINAIKSLGIIFKDPRANKMLKNIQIIDNVEELKSKLKNNRMN